MDYNWIQLIAINLNQVIIVQIILEDDDGNSFMVFVNALILSAAAYVFDSYDKEANNSASNSPSVKGKMISDCFDCEYWVIKYNTSRTRIFDMIRGTDTSSAVLQEFLVHQRQLYLLATQRLIDYPARNKLSRSSITIT